jgi:hypothetical protein
MYDESHETLEGLRRLFAGQASPAEADRAAAHLAHLTGCRACWLLAARAIEARKAKGKIVVQGPLRLVVDLHEMEPGEKVPGEQRRIENRWARFQAQSPRPPSELATTCLGRPRIVRPRHV